MNALLGSNLLEDGDDKYYSIILLRMDAKKYVLSNYYWKMFWRFASFFIVFLTFRRFFLLSSTVCFLYPIFNIMMKTIFNYLRIQCYINGKNTMNTLLWPVSILCISIAFILPILNITIYTFIFKIMCIVVYVLGIYSFWKIGKFDGYYKMYKEYLMPESKEVEKKMKSFNIYSQNNVDIILKCLI